MKLPSPTLLSSIVLAASALGSSPAFAEETPPAPASAPHATGPLARLDPLPPPPPASRFRKPAMMVSGAAVTAIGVALVATGVAIYARGITSQRSCGPQDECLGPGFDMGAGILAGSFGLAHLAVGVPLLVVGARPPRASDTPAALPLPPPALSTRSLGLAWTF